LTGLTGLNAGLFESVLKPHDRDAFIALDGGKMGSGFNPVNPVNPVPKNKTQMVGTGWISRRRVMDGRGGF
jgi:hypothetical protein